MLDDGVIMDHQNRFLSVIDYVRALIDSPEVRRLYILNLRIWFRCIEADGRAPPFFRRKCHEVVHLMTCFSRGDWLGLYMEVEKHEEILKEAKASHVILI